MKKIVVLDNGHGGVINGIYQTAGKRSPEWEHGVLYEGAYNREMVARIATKLDAMGIPYRVLVPELEDISLAKRVERVNAMAKKENVWLLSIHANAGGGTGIEAFTSKGKTVSDAIADVVLSDIEKGMPSVKMRYDKSDGDLDKEENFYVLSKSSCPAVLLELMFMDNKNDYKLMFDEGFKDEMACIVSNSIARIYNGNY